MKPTVTILGLRPPTFFLIIAFMSVTLMLLDQPNNIFWMVLSMNSAIASYITTIMEENNNG